MIKMKSMKIKWKLAFWSAILMVALFLTYNFLQYFVMNAWIVHHEEQSIQSKMDDILRFYQREYQNQPSPTQLKDSKRFLEGINENSETIRVLNENGKALLSVSQHDLLIPKKKTWGSNTF
jgi:two-component system sensor histidine kinase ArlS